MKDLKNIKSGRLNSVVAIMLISGLTVTPIAPAYALPAASLPEILRADIDAYEIPAEIGSIIERYRGENGKAVIYVEDAHDSLEAQENIAAIIRRMTGEYGVRTVFEEGFTGPVPTDELFGTIADAGVKEKVSYFLLDKLRIGGAEYAHINREKDFNLIGADSIKLHLENIEWYQKTARDKETTDQDLAELRHHITRLTDRYFPKALKDWMKLKARLDSDEIDLVDYLARMKAFSPDLSAYPHIDLLLSARRTDDREIFEQVRHIKPARLFREIDRMENDFAASQLGEPRDRKIFTYVKGIGLLARLSAIKITSAEYEAVKDALEDLKTEPLARFIAAHTGKSIVLSKRWEENIAGAMAFYKTALKRDLAIREQFGTFARSAAEHTAVLVFGGFHKERILAMLKENGFSYAVVTPRITSASERHRDYYKRLMTVGYHPFEVPLNVRLASRPQGLVEMSTGFGRAVVSAVEAAVVRSALTGPTEAESPALMVRALDTALGEILRTEPRAYGFGIMGRGDSDNQSLGVSSTEKAAPRDQSISVQSIRRVSDAEKQFQAHLYDRLDEFSRFSWMDPDGEPVEAYLDLHYDHVFGHDIVAHVYPAIQEIERNPALQTLNETPSMAGAPDRGSFGRLRLVESVVTVKGGKTEIQPAASLEEAAVEITQVQSSYGFHRLGVGSIDEELRGVLMRRYRDWKSAAIEYILRIAQEVSYKHAVAASASTVREENPNRPDLDMEFMQFQTISDASLFEHYIRPFRGNWDKVSLFKARTNELKTFWYRQLEPGTSDSGTMNPATRFGAHKEKTAPPVEAFGDILDARTRPAGFGRARSAPSVSTEDDRWASFARELEEQIPRYRAAVEKNPWRRFKGTVRDGRLRGLWNAMRPRLMQRLRKDRTFIVNLGSGNGEWTRELMDELDATQAPADAGGPVVEILNVDPVSFDEPGLTFAEAQAEDLRGVVDDGVVDIAWMMFALSYTDRDRVIEEIKRILKPGGYGLFVLHHPRGPITKQARLVAGQFRQLHAFMPRAIRYLRGMEPFQELTAEVAKVVDVLDRLLSAKAVNEKFLDRFTKSLVLLERIHTGGPFSFSRPQMSDDDIRTVLADWLEAVKDLMRREGGPMYEKLLERGALFEDSAEIKAFLRSHGFNDGQFNVTELPLGDAKEPAVYLVELTNGAALAPAGFGADENELTVNDLDVLRRVTHLGVRQLMTQVLRGEVLPDEAAELLMDADTQGFDPDQLEDVYEAARAKSLLGGKLKQRMRRLRQFIEFIPASDIAQLERAFERSGGPDEPIDIIPDASDSATKDSTADFDSRPGRDPSGFGSGEESKETARGFTSKQFASPNERLVRWSGEALTDAIARTAETGFNDFSPLYDIERRLRGAGDKTTWNTTVVKLEEELRAASVKGISDDNMLVRAVKHLNDQWLIPRGILLWFMYVGHGPELKDLAESLAVSIVEESRMYTVDGKEFPVYLARERYLPGPSPYAADYQPMGFIKINLGKIRSRSELLLKYASDLNNHPEFDIQTLRARVGPSNREVLYGFYRRMGDTHASADEYTRILIERSIWEELRHAVDFYRAGWLTDEGTVEFDDTHLDLFVKKLTKDGGVLGDVVAQWDGDKTVLLRVLVELSGHLTRAAAEPDVDITWSQWLEYFTKAGAEDLVESEAGYAWTARLAFQLIADELGVLDHPLTAESMLNTPLYSFPRIVLNILEHSQDEIRRAIKAVYARAFVYPIDEPPFPAIPSGFGAMLHGKAEANNHTRDAKRPAFLEAILPAGMLSALGFGAPASKSSGLMPIVMNRTVWVPVEIVENYSQKGEAQIEEDIERGFLRRDGSGQLFAPVIRDPSISHPITKHGRSVASEISAEDIRRGVRTRVAKGAGLEKPILGVPFGYNKGRNVQAQRFRGGEMLKTARTVSETALGLWRAYERDVETKDLTVRKAAEQYGIDEAPFQQPVYLLKPLKIPVDLDGTLTLLAPSEAFQRAMDSTMAGILARDQIINIYDVPVMLRVDEYDPSKEEMLFAAFNTAYKREMLRRFSARVALAIHLVHRRLKSHFEVSPGVSGLHVKDTSVTGHTLDLGARISSTRRSDVRAGQATDRREATQIIETFSEKLGVSPDAGLDAFYDILFASFRADTPEPFVDLLRRWYDFQTIPGPGYALDQAVSRDRRTARVSHQLHMAVSMIEERVKAGDAAKNIIERVRTRFERAADERRHLLGTEDQGVEDLRAFASFSYLLVPFVIYDYALDLDRNGEDSHADTQRGFGKRDSEDEEVREKAVTWNPVSASSSTNPPTALLPSWRIFQRPPEKSPSQPPFLGGLGGVHNHPNPNISSIDNDSTRRSDETEAGFGADGEREKEQVLALYAPEDRAYVGRIAEYAVAIAEKMELPADEIDIVRKAALLHYAAASGATRDVRVWLDRLIHAEDASLVASELLAEGELRKDIETPLYEQAQSYAERWIDTKRIALTQADALDGRNSLEEFNLRLSRYGIGKNGTLPAALREALKLFFTADERTLAAVKTWSESGALPFTVTTRNRFVLRAYGQLANGMVTMKSESMKLLAMIVLAAAHIEFVNHAERNVWGDDLIRQDSEFKPVHSMSMTIDELDAFLVDRLTGKAGLLRHRVRDAALEVLWDASKERNQLLPLLIEGRGGEPITQDQWKTFGDELRLRGFIPEIEEKPLPPEIEPATKTEALVIGGAGSKGPGQSSFLISHGRSAILLDAGEGSVKSPTFQTLTRAPDALLATHAHNDHIGDVPNVLHAFPGLQVYMTGETQSTAASLWRDGIKFQHMPKGEARRRLHHAEENLHAIETGVWYRLGDETKVLWSPSSHILGASMIYVATPYGNWLYTGDFALDDMHAAEALKHLRDFPVDRMIMEATYGDRVQSESRIERENALASSVKKVFDRGGKVLIPAFTIGRTPEAALILRKRQAAGEILPDAPIYIAGMAVDIMNRYRSYLAASKDEENRAKYNLLFGPASTVVLLESKDRELLYEWAGESDQPGIILAGSGMLAGGYSQGLLPVVGRDDKNGILLVGWQEPRSIGRKLIDGQRNFVIERRRVHIGAEVFFHGLSAHADQEQLVELVRTVDPRGVTLVHGDGRAKRTLQNLITGNGFADVRVAGDGGKIELNLPARLRRERRTLFDSLEAAGPLPVKIEKPMLETDPAEAEGARPLTPRATREERPAVSKVPKATETLPPRKRRKETRPSYPRKTTSSEIRKQETEDEFLAKILAAYAPGLPMANGRAFRPEEVKAVLGRFLAEDKLIRAANGGFSVSAAAGALRRSLPPGRQGKTFLEDKDWHTIWQGLAADFAGSVGFGAVPVRVKVEGMKDVSHEDLFTASTLAGLFSELRDQIAEMKGRDFFAIVKSADEKIEKIPYDDAVWRARALKQGDRVTFRAAVRDLSFKLFSGSSDLFQALSEGERRAALYVVSGWKMFEADHQIWGAGKKNALLAYSEGRPIAAHAFKVVSRTTVEASGIYVAREQQWSGVGLKLRHALLSHLKASGFERFDIKRIARTGPAFIFHRRFVDALNSSGNEAATATINPREPKNVNREAILDAAEESPRGWRGDVRPSARPALDQTSHFVAALSIEDGWINSVRVDLTQYRPPAEADPEAAPAEKHLPVLMQAWASLDGRLLADRYQLVAPASEESAAVLSESARQHLERAGGRRLAFVLYDTAEERFVEQAHFITHFTTERDLGPGGHFYLSEEPQKLRGEGLFKAFWTQLGESVREKAAWAGDRGAFKVHINIYERNTLERLAEHYMTEEIPDALRDGLRDNLAELRDEERSHMKEARLNLLRMGVSEAFKSAGAPPEAVLRETLWGHVLYEAGWAVQSLGLMDLTDEGEGDDEIILTAVMPASEANVDTPARRGAGFGSVIMRNVNDRMPAWELASALGLLEPPEDMAGIAVTGRRDFGDSKVYRITLGTPAAGPPRGLDMLPSELADVNTFELLYNGRGNLIAVFPVLPSGRTTTEKDGIRYFDLSAYYFEVPDVNDKDAMAKWSAFSTAWHQDQDTLRRYMDTLPSTYEGLKPANDVRVEERKRYMYASFDKQRSDYELISFDPDGFDPVRFRPDPGKDQLIFPLFPTVYRPIAGGDTLFRLEKIYRDQIRTGRDLDLQKGHRALVVGPGTGLEAWLVSLKTARPVYAVGINPLEIANSRALARTAGFTLNAKVHDNIISPDGVPAFDIRFHRVIWNMPLWAPPLTVEDSKVPRRYRRHWDGDYGGKTLARFARGLAASLQPGDRALIWNAYTYDLDGISPVAEEFKRAGLNADAIEFGEGRVFALYLITPQPNTMLKRSAGFGTQGEDGSDRDEIRFSTDDLLEFSDETDVSALTGMPPESTFGDFTIAELVFIFSESPYTSVSDRALDELVRKEAREAFVPLRKKTIEAFRELKVARRAKDEWLYRNVVTKGAMVGAVGLSFDDQLAMEYHTFRTTITGLNDRLNYFRNVRYELHKIFDPQNKSGLPPPPLDRILSATMPRRYPFNIDGPFNFEQTALHAYVTKMVTMFQWENLVLERSELYEKVIEMEDMAGDRISAEFTQPTRERREFLTVRRFDILKHRTTGNRYFVSQYEPNAIFSMMAGYLFYDLLGLPVRETYVVMGEKNQPRLVRERIENGVRFENYSNRYGLPLKFNEHWQRVLRASLLADQIIGYTDRDDSNLFAVVMPDGDPIPLFVDMKFSFGYPKGSEADIAYDFSKYVIRHETGTLPDGFAHNLYHSAATPEDMRWMAERLRPISADYLDEIISVVDELVPGHTFDLPKLRREWRRSLAKAKALYDISTQSAGFGSEAEPDSDKDVPLRITLSDLPEIVEISDLEEPRSLENLSKSELIVLLHSPYSNVFEAALERVKELRIEDAIPFLEGKLTELNGEALRILNEKRAWIRKHAIREGQSVGGMRLNLDDQYAREYMTLRDRAGSLNREIRRFQEIIRTIRDDATPLPLEHIKKKAVVPDRYPFGLDRPFDMESSALAAALKREDEGLTLDDFRKVDTYFYEKEVWADFGEGLEPTLFVRAFDTLELKTSKQRFTVSGYEPAAIFSMMAGYLFFDLLGLPVQKTLVLSDRQGNPLIVRELIENSARFGDDYREQFGEELDFSERWARVLRGSLLIDEIIGYTDRNENNLLAVIMPDGERIPIFMDMKIALGNQRMVDVHRTGPPEIIYDFSKYVVSHNKGHLPEPFHYNPYHAAAGLDDMKWMAERLAPITETHIDQIIDTVDELVPGHPFHLNRLRAEWKKSLAKAKTLYGITSTSTGFGAEELFREMRPLVFDGDFRQAKRIGVTDTGNEYPIFEVGGQKVVRKYGNALSPWRIQNVSRMIFDARATYVTARALRFDGVQPVQFLVDDDGRISDLEDLFGEPLDRFLSATEIDELKHILDVAFDGRDPVLYDQFAARFGSSFVQGDVFRLLANSHEDSHRELNMRIEEKGGKKVFRWIDYGSLFHRDRDFDEYLRRYFSAYQQSMLTHAPELLRRIVAMDSGMIEAIADEAYGTKTKTFLIKVFTDAQQGRLVAEIEREVVEELDTRRNRFVREITERSKVFKAFFQNRLGFGVAQPVLDAREIKQRVGWTSKSEDEYFAKRILPDLEAVFAEGSVFYSVAGPLLDQVLARATSYELLDWIVFRLFELNETGVEIDRADVSQFIENIANEKPDFPQHSAYGPNNESGSWFSSTSWRITRQLNAFTRDRGDDFWKGKHVLEVGPGYDRRLIKWFVDRGAAVTVTDASWRAARLARQDYGVRALRSDILDLAPFKEGEFDAVIASSVVYYALRGTQQVVDDQASGWLFDLDTGERTMQLRYPAKWSAARTAQLIASVRRVLKENGIFGTSFYHYLENDPIEDGTPLLIDHRMPPNIRKRFTDSGFAIRDDFRDGEAILFTASGFGSAVHPVKKLLEDNTNPSALGKAREAAGLSQKSVWEEMGVNERALLRIERGEDESEESSERFKRAIGRLLAARRREARLYRSEITKAVAPSGFRLGFAVAVEAGRWRSLDDLRDYDDVFRTLMPRKLRGIREAAGLSQKQVAEQAFVSESTIRKIENGGSPHPQNLENVHRAIGALLKKRRQDALLEQKDIFTDKKVKLTNAMVRMIIEKGRAMDPSKVLAYRKAIERRQGPRLRERRRSMGFTQADLERALGMKEGTVAWFEKGTGLDTSIIKQLHDTLDVMGRMALKRYRRAVSLSQRDVAVRAGVSRALVYDIEEGRVRRSSADVWRRLFRAIDELRGPLLRKRREDAGLTRADLERESGISAKVIYDMEGNPDYGRNIDKFEKAHAAITAYLYVMKGYLGVVAYAATFDERYMGDAIRAAPVEASGELELRMALVRSMIPELKGEPERTVLGLVMEGHSVARIAHLLSMDPETEITPAVASGVMALRRLIADRFPDESDIAFPATGFGAGEEPDPKARRIILNDTEASIAEVVKVDMLDDVRSPLVFGIGAKTIASLTAEEWTRFWTLKALNEKMLHLLITFDDIGELGNDRIRELRRDFKNVYVGAWSSQLPEEAPVYFFSDPTGGVHPRTELDPRLVRRIGGRYFGTNFPLALLFQYHDEQLEGVRIVDGYYRDVAGWWTERALDALLKTYVTIAVAA